MCILPRFWEKSKVFLKFYFQPPDFSYYSFIKAYFLKFVKLFLKHPNKQPASEALLGTAISLLCTS